MKLHVFSVHDMVARAYLPPFFLPRTEMAQRTFADCINSASHQFGKNPQDYTLLHLGQFDDDSAEFSLFDIPKSLGLGTSFIRSEVRDVA